MHLVRRGLRLNERAQIHTGLAVRRQPHHFPFVAVAVKSQIFCEFAVEISDRIRKRNCQNVLEPPAAARAKSMSPPTPRAHPSQRQPHHRIRNTNTRSAHAPDDDPQIASAPSSLQKSARTASPLPLDATCSEKCSVEFSPFIYVAGICPVA